MIKFTDCVDNISKRGAIDGDRDDAVVSLEHQGIRSDMLLSRVLFLLHLNIIVLISLTFKAIGNNVNEEVVVVDPCPV